MASSAETQESWVAHNILEAFKGTTDSAWILGHSIPSQASPGFQPPFCSPGTQRELAGSQRMKWTQEGATLTQERFSVRHPLPPAPGMGMQGCDVWGHHMCTEVTSHGCCLIPGPSAHCLPVFHTQPCSGPAPSQAGGGFCASGLFRLSQSQMTCVVFKLRTH